MADGGGQVGGVDEPGERVVDLLARGATALDEMRRGTADGAPSPSRRCADAPVLRGG